MGNEMGNNNTTATLHEEDNTASEDQTKSLQETVLSNDVHGEDHVVPASESKDIDETETGFASNGSTSGAEDNHGSDGKEEENTISEEQEKPLREHVHMNDMQEENNAVPASDSKDITVKGADLHSTDSNNHIGNQTSDGKEQKDAEVHPPAESPVAELRFSEADGEDSEIPTDYLSRKLDEHEKTSEDNTVSEDQTKSLQETVFRNDVHGEDHAVPASESKDIDATETGFASNGLTGADNQTSDGKEEESTNSEGQGKSLREPVHTNNMQEENNAVPSSDSKDITVKGADLDSTDSNNHVGNHTSDGKEQKDAEVHPPAESRVTELRFSEANSEDSEISTAYLSRKLDEHEKTSEDQENLPESILVKNHSDTIHNRTEQQDYLTKGESEMFNSGSATTTQLQNPEPQDLVESKFDHEFAQLDAYQSEKDSSNLQTEIDARKEKDHAVPASESKDNDETKTGFVSNGLTGAEDNHGDSQTSDGKEEENTISEVQGNFLRAPVHTNDMQEENNTVPASDSKDITVKEADLDSTDSINHVGNQTSNGKEQKDAEVHHPTESPVAELRFSEAVGKDCEIPTAYLSRKSDEHEKTSELQEKLPESILVENKSDSGTIHNQIEKQDSLTKGESEMLNSGSVTTTQLQNPEPQDLVELNFDHEFAQLDAYQSEKDGSNLQTEIDDSHHISNVESAKTPAISSDSFELETGVDLAANSINSIVEVSLPEDKCMVLTDETKLICEESENEDNKEDDSYVQFNKELITESEINMAKVDSFIIPIDKNDENEDGAMEKNEMGFEDEPGSSELTLELKPDNIFVAKPSTFHARSLTVDFLASAAEKYEQVERFSTESNPNNFSSQMRKSPSFNFDLRTEERSEESDRIPLLCNQESLEEESKAVEEKVISLERSDSDKSRTPFLGFLKQDEETRDLQKSDSKKVESVSGPAKVKDKHNKRRSSLFTNCMCCATVIN